MRPARAQRKVGTAFRFGLSEPAEVKIRIERRLRGYRNGRRCTTRKPGAQKRRRCTLHKRAKTLEVRARVGSNQGQVHGQGPAPGRYRATAIATDPDGMSSRPRRVTFTVVKP